MFSKKLILTLLLGSILIAVGCNTLVGGGWLDGLEGGKAHFGFNIRCVDTDLGPVAQGQFQYSDKSVGVRFHGRFDGYSWIEGYESCEEAGIAAASGGHDFTAEAAGNCRTQPGKRTGRFYVSVTDNSSQDGTPDYITVATHGCGVLGDDHYTNAGFIEGGNITAILGSED